MRNPERNAKWIKAVGRKDFIPTKSSLLCHNHFLRSDFRNPVGGSYKLLLRNDAVPSVFNTNTNQTSTKINWSEFDKPTTNQLNVPQQSDISTSVSNSSYTTELSTSVKDEPLCLTMEKNMCTKSAEEETPILINPSKCKITISPYKKTSASNLELKNKLKSQAKAIKLLKQQVKCNDIRINTLETRLKLLEDKQI